MSRYYVFYNSVYNFFYNKENGWFFRIHSGSSRRNGWVIDKQSQTHYKFSCVKDHNYHNTSGPAIIYCSLFIAGGNEYLTTGYSYYIEGDIITPELFWKHPLVIKTKLQMINEL